LGWVAVSLVCIGTNAVYAQRQPVLKQIDLPHNYYFREMYLPQLTSGPSAVAFSPDGRALAYSMQGSLWRQALDSTEAEQLTAGPGYDFQPDWSPDGRSIVFARYNDDAVELTRLDLASGAVTPLTRNHGVNVEPRWSPDGKQIAWVSTEGTGHFHIFVGTLNAASLMGHAVWPERRSHTARYYYSAFDHEISPTWSPDGKALIYVSNPENVYGTGGIWRRALDANAEPVAIRLEETTWKARPAWSPDGKRVLYSSYAGRQWHQLWVTTSTGTGDPFPLSYGDFDATNARWSPDASRIAFISNRSGSTEIWLQDVIGGAQRKLEIRTKRYRQPMSELHLQTVDAAGKPIPARVSVLAADGRAYAPDDAWIHADDSFDRKRSRFETQYFHTQGDSRLTLPPGNATVTVWRGMENQVAQHTVQIKSGGSPQDLQIKVQPLSLPPGWSDQWRSADVHVHMNYGGTYRNTPERLVRQAAAEDLDIVFNLVVNKEQRVPDIDVFSPLPDRASTSAVLLLHGQEYHTSYWGHLGLLGLNDHFLLPDYSAYANTAAASLYPTNGAVADLAHAQHGLVGYVHPFDETPDPKASAPLTNALPIDVARGKVDYYEVVGFSEHRTSAAVWYRLLNCGFRPAAAAGTDAMANYASLRGPVGMNRVYAQIDGGAKAASDEGDLSDRKQRWLDALRAGRTMATNGPLVGLTVEDKPPGSEITLQSSGSGTLRYKGFLRSIAPIDHLELVMNGNVVRTLSLDRTRTRADFEGTIKAPDAGWLLVRAWNDGASPLVFDLYPYATTNAVFFKRPGGVTHCGRDAEYFIAWLDRLESAAAAHDGYNTPAEREATLGEIRAARQVFSERR
jgi:Tol biopolymer transport system component